MLGNKPPYTTMQQLNLDWVLSKLKTLLRLVPDDGAVGQILRRTRDGAVWSDEQGGGGGGAVESVNGKTGAVVLDASDVGALPDNYTPPVTSVNGQTGAVVVAIPVQSVNGQTGAVVIGKSDVGLANVDNVRQYSATNPPPYPVTSVNGQTGAVVIPTGGNVDSVNGQTGTVVLDASDVGALPDDYTPPVTSVNGQTGDVTIPTFAVHAVNISGTTDSSGDFNLSSYISISNQVPIGFRKTSSFAFSTVVFGQTSSGAAWYMKLLNDNAGNMAAQAFQGTLFYLDI